MCLWISGFPFLNPGATFASQNILNGVVRRYESVRKCNETWKYSNASLLYTAEKEKYEND